MRHASEVLKEKCYLCNVIKTREEMKVVDINVAIVATATASFIAAYNLTDKKTVEALSEAFVALAQKWYAENGEEEIDLESEVFCEESIIYAVSAIAQAHEMSEALAKMMSFGK
jgi:hypothetical protein